MRTKRVAAALSTALVLGLVACSGPDAASGDRGTLTMAVPTGVFDVAPIAIGIEQGLFADAGVDVKLEIVHDGVDATKALIGHKVDLALTGGAAVMQAVAADSGVKLAAPVVQTSPYLLATREQLSGVEDLRGKSIAVSELGSSSDLAARQALAANGIDVADVHIRPLGGNSERMAAVVAGSADAVVLSSERRKTAEQLGLHVLVDFTKQQIQTLNIAIAALDSDLSGAPDLAGKLRDAVQKSLAFVVDPANKDVVMEQTAKYLELKTDDPETQDTYQYFVDNQGNPLVMPTDGKFVYSVIEADLAALSKGNKDIESLTPGDVVAEGSLAQ